MFARTYSSFVVPVNSCLPGSQLPTFLAVATVRRAVPEDRARAIRTATRAFAPDPLIRWFFPDDATYEDEAAVFFGLQFDLRVEGGEVWTTDDGVTVAMWDTPGASTVDQEWRDQTWNQGIAVLPQRSRDRLDALGRAVGPWHLEEAHWYLGILATHPDWQRSGLGRGVLRPVLVEADRNGLVAALLTETPENVAFVSGARVRGGRGARDRGRRALRPGPQGLGHATRARRRRPVSTSTRANVVSPPSPTGCGCSVG